MYPFTMSTNTSFYPDTNNNSAANRITVCQSCQQNATGIDLNLIREKNEKSLLDENFVTVKCLDCNHFLCFTCYLAHGNMQYFQHHRFETIPLPQQMYTKRKLTDMDLVSEDSFSAMNKSAKTTDWPPAFVPNADLGLDFNRLTSVISPEQSPPKSLWIDGEEFYRENPTLRDQIAFHTKVMKKKCEIENQIMNTFEFCEQILNLHRKTLLNELKDRIYEMDTESYENIEFVTNLHDLKSCIKEMIGHIKWPCGFTDSALSVIDKSNQKQDHFRSLGPFDASDRMTPLSMPIVETSKVPIINPIAHITLPFKYRAKMEMKLKFGGNGLENNRFTEPNGISIDKDKNIIVADSNSNYMKCFEPDGTYRFKFGIEKLLFPNKVACHKKTGNFVIIERKPAHEIKIFSPQGDFIRRFGSGLLKSPRGVCIDRNSRIIILESKIMRILIFTMDGGLMHYFDVSEYFKFANSICTSNTEDVIYISDNHSHCIKAFSYEGNFLRQLGGVGLTNYPTSVDMNSKNELMITDNYNCFNLTILSQNGDLLRAFESKTKHSRILDVSVVDDETILFSSRDNFIYKYKF